MYQVKLLTKKKVPLDYANVVALSKDSTFIAGTTSNENGDFSIPSFEHPKKCLLKISFIGYESKYISCTSDDMGTISLSPSAVMLKEAVITAKRPTFRMKDGGLITNIPGSILSKAGTANDVLSQLPNVQGHGGTFTVFGKGTPLIYLNGKLLQDYNILEQLSSSDIQSIEVITTPGAKYDATSRAVILIKTIKKVGDGMSGSLRSVYSQAHKSGFTEQANLNYRKGGIDVFSTLFYNSHYNKQEQGSIQEIYNKVLQNSEARILSHTQNLYGMLGMNYEINKEHSIGLKYTIDKRPGNSKTDNDNKVIFNGEPEKTIHYSTDESFPFGINHQTNAYYNGRIGKLQIDYNFDYVFKKNSQNQHIIESEEGKNIQEITTDNHNKSQLFASKLILSHPLGMGKIDFGTEYTHTMRNNIFTNVQGILGNTDEEIKESNISGFAEYAAQWGNWMFNAGLRYQFTASDYYEDNILNDGQSRKYSNLLPDISIGYGGEKIQAQLSYTAKAMRPAYYMLAGNVQYDNRYTYEGGNPLLQPSTYHSIDFETMYSWVYFSASYCYKKDEILNVDKPYENDAVLFTFDNSNKIQSLNAMLSFSPKFGFWEPIYGIGVCKQFIKAHTLNINEKLEKPIFQFKLNNSFSLPGRFLLGVNFRYTTEGNAGTRLEKSQKSLDLSLYKNFLKDKLSVQLQGFDIFKNGYNSSIYYGSNMRMNIKNYSDARSFRLTLSYKFNATRNKYKGT